ncbi:MAG: hypothetical protein JETCAE03_31640 [Ignavibacteriaceae bacterium]|nr:MAG: hypothetical protein BroJett017_23740 [Ignavibacteriota bacterium]GJQ43666.1 MAG: hypothetical protein JETCAE03_31640 [Ignavibacteriaceae bacterium]
MWNRDAETRISYSLSFKTELLDMHNKKLKFFTLGIFTREFLLLENFKLTGYIYIGLTNNTVFYHFSGGLYGE